MLRICSNNCKSINNHGQPFISVLAALSPLLSQSEPWVAVFSAARTGDI